MSDNKPLPIKKNVSADWLVRGVLTRVGEIFDRLTGRNWKPSSGLATSELIEKLKQLLDAEARDIGGKRKFVPHNIKLKMQWDKFSTDAETAIGKLENELLIAAIDHINDQRYYTYAPLKLEIKPDYFTEGVKLLAGFDNFGDEETGREAAINVSIPDLKNVIINQPPEIAVEPEKERFAASFTIKENLRTKELAFAVRQRLSVGRTKENDLWLDDISVSKMHAALILNSEKLLVVADTGSTNGTFINGERIAYGRAFVVKAEDKLRFGTVEVALERLVSEAETSAADEAQTPSEQELSASKTEVFASDEVEMRENIKTMENSAQTEIMSPTEQNIVLDFKK